MSPVPRPMDLHTLHFDLRHCPAAEFTLRAHGRHYPLRIHTPETLKAYAAHHPALALIPAERRGEITHFVEDVELAADAVGLAYVSYPAADPAALLPDLAVVFTHVPRAARRRAYRRRLRKGPVDVPAVLRRYGVSAFPADGAEEVLLAATTIQTPLAGAKSIIASHPDVASLNPDVAAYVLDQYIDAGLTQDPSLISYISSNGPGTATPWYTQTVSQAPDGTPLSPATDLTDQNGQTVVWPTQDDVPVVPQYSLSDGVIGSTDGTVPGAAMPVIQLVLQISKQAAEMAGQLWTTQHGITATQQTGVDPGAPGQGNRFMRSLGAPPAGTGYEWSMSFLTSQYGVDLDQGSLVYDETDALLTFSVKNWANRSLGVYVQFLDETGAPIPLVDGVNWTDNLPAALQPLLEPSPSKKYLQYLGAGNVIFGIPAWTDYVTISVSPVPSNAAKTEVLLGGLGIGGFDSDVDVPGIVATCVLNYGVPAVMTVLSIGLQSTSWYMSLFDDPENFEALLKVAVPLFATVFTAGLLELNTAYVLTKAGDLVAGVVFGSGVGFLAQKLTGYTTLQEISDNAPFLGWALRVANCANSIADMIATTVEVCLSPATYDIEIARSLDVSATTSPDPAHGTPGQAPVWPEVSDHWVVTVLYKGGTYYQQTGPMPSVNDQPITTLFPAIPAAPGDSIQVTTSVYSADGWLAGKWVSPWVPMVATSGTTLALSGSIIESLVPLSAGTQYLHKQKLVYADGAHQWEITSAPAETVAAQDCANTGNAICAWVGTTINNDAYALGYTWEASGQDLPLDSGTDPEEVQMYTFQSISVLSDPESGMKSPTQGFSQQPYLVFDPFGPQPLFTLPASFEPELDAGGAVPADLAAAFASASVSYALPAGATATVVTAGAQWQLQNGGETLYNLVVATDPTQTPAAQIIQVFSQPATTFLFSVPVTYASELDSGEVSADLQAAFETSGSDYGLPQDAQITVVTQSADWTIGVAGETALYEVRREVDVLQVFGFPAPAFSSRNFWLDPRDLDSTGTYYLRQVSLGDGSSTFDYGTGESFGTFVATNVSAMAVHPNGYVVAVDYVNHKMQILELPDAAVPDDQAQPAQPVSGKGVREGLMLGPVAMTVTPDGRILVLEQDNARIQAFDTLGNPVQCFAGPLSFSLDPSFSTDLDGGTFPIGFQAAYQSAVQPTLASVASLPGSDAPSLDQGAVPADLVSVFSGAGIALGSTLTVSVTTAGSLWLLQDTDNAQIYDLRTDPDDAAVDVYRAAVFAVEVQQTGVRGLIRSNPNPPTFQVSAGATAGADLGAQQQVAICALKDPAGTTVTYLDLAVETKSFIYVLSYADDGAQLSDYHLDIYNPDGSWLARTPDDASAAGVNGARMTVDQWRNLYTMNYETLLGPGGRTEPSVSVWVPSTP